MISVLKGINNVVFAGNGHGGIVAFKSLIPFFKEIHVLTNDEDIKALLRDSDKLISQFNESDSLLIVCAGYHEIISKDLTEKKIIINTHPSLLPKYRGLHALAWAMLNLEQEVGFSIHLMNEFIDDGDILEQFKITYNGETSNEIMVMFDQYVENNLGRVIHEYANGKLIPIKQNKLEATWVTKRNQSDCLIDFTKGNSYLRAMFKTLVAPYPLPQIKIKKSTFEVLDHRIIDINYEMHIGRVVNIENEEVYVKVSEGLLVFRNVKNNETKVIEKASSLLKIGQRLC